MRACPQKQLGARSQAQRCPGPQPPDPAPCRLWAGAVVHAVWGWGWASAFGKQTARGWGHSGGPGRRQGGRAPVPVGVPATSPCQGSGRPRHWLGKAQSFGFPGAGPSLAPEEPCSAARPAVLLRVLSLGSGPGPEACGEGEERTRSGAALLWAVAGGPHRVPRLLLPPGDPCPVGCTACPQVHSDRRPFLWSSEAHTGSRCQLTPGKVARPPVQTGFHKARFITRQAGSPRVSLRLRSQVPTVTSSPWRPQSLPQRPLMWTSPAVSFCSSVLRALGPTPMAPAPCRPCAHPVPSVLCSPGALAWLFPPGALLPQHPGARRRRGAWGPELKRDGPGKRVGRKQRSEPLTRWLQSQPRRRPRTNSQAGPGRAGRAEGAGVALHQGKDRGSRRRQPDASPPTLPVATGASRHRTEDGTDHPHSTLARLKDGRREVCGRHDRTEMLVQTGSRHPGHHPPAAY